MNYVSPVERYGFEDEETRRKREEEERKRMGETEIGSTTEKTYMDGSKTITQTREVPGGAQAMRPVMPIQPTSPDDFVRIRQIESGNRDFTPQGQPVTSPKGAMFASQVMPATAQQPGFGIRPAQSQTPEEYNRVGQEYFQAMRNRYNDDTVAAAAYNAGPGRVDQALKRAQETGQPFTNFLPQETQQYIQKFNQGRQPAQVQQQQQLPTMPRGGILALPSVGASAEGAEGEQVAQQRLQQYNQTFLANQDNIPSLLKLKDDPTAPISVQNLASERAFELLNTQRNKSLAENEGKQLLASNDTKKIGNILSSDPEDEKGSYLKLFFLGFVSPEAARMEASKLGLVPTAYKASTIINEDGTQTAVQLKTRADGKVVGGIDMEGNPLSAKQLEKAVAGIGTRVKPDVGEFVERNGVVGRLVTKYDANNNPRTVVEAGGKEFAADNTWKPRAISTAQAKADITTMASLQRTHGGNVLAAERQYEKDAGAFGTPSNPMSREQFREQYRLFSGMPAGGMPQAPQAPSVPQTPQPVQAPAVPTAMPQAQGAVQTQPGMPVAPGQQPAQVSGTPAREIQPQQVASPFPTLVKPQPRQAFNSESEYKQHIKQVEQQNKALEASWITEQKKLGENRAKDIEALPTVERSASDILALIKTMRDHPAFETSVGITWLPGARLIPASPQKDFYAMADNLKGNSFLEAIGRLKGSGPVSEKEGTVATKAINMLGDLNLSEKAWLKEADRAMISSKKLVDGERIRLGLEPKYFVGQDKEALDWLEKNPNHKDSEAVRRKLALKGL